MGVRRCGVLFFGALLAFGVPARDLGRAEQIPARGKILATYQVELAGLNLGEFHLAIALQGRNYEIEGNGRFSLLAGTLFRGGGNAESSGTLTKAGPQPSTFAVRFEGGGKKERRRMSFADGDVDKISIIPQKKQGRRRVPVTKDQLEDVLDPLSAALLNARHDNPACNNTLPIFDGRLRFDIVLTPKREDTLPKEAPTDLSGPAAVCEVKFVPIAGHKPDNPGLKFMAETDEIEVWLVPLPRTAIYLPYWVGLPTPLGRGSATLTEIKVTLDGPARRQPTSSP
jgi:hypothetical protein